MPDGRSLLASVDELGQEALYSIDAHSGTRAKLVGTGQVSEYSATRDSVVFALAHLGAPADLYLISASAASLSDSPR